MCVPMGDIELMPPASVEAKRSPVNFPHSRHFNNDCKSCHHKWEGNAKIQNCTTAGCHDQVAAPKTKEKYLKYSDISIKYYKYAFHSQCVGCHKEIKQKRKAMEMSHTTLKDKLPATGPTGCKGCHPAQE
ncbi:MAG: cytochrome c3 family protein [Deltaproteobacteria bacterium]|nr:cytochrome c3 family protein [Deltaproteobacteria bacterium]